MISSSSSRERFAGAVYGSLFCTRFARQPLHLCLLTCTLPHPTSALARRKPSPPDYYLPPTPPPHIHRLLVACLPTAARRASAHSRHTQGPGSPLKLPEGDFAPFFGGVGEFERASYCESCQPHIALLAHTVKRRKHATAYFCLRLATGLA